MAVTIVKIGKNVRAKRERLFLTQAQFAERAGIDRDTLGRIERDEVEPRFSTIIKIAETLDVNPSELVDED